MLKALKKRRIFLTALTVSASAAAIAAPLGALLTANHSAPSDSSLTRNASAEQPRLQRSYEPQVSSADYSITNYRLHNASYGIFTQFSEIDRSIDLAASTPDNVVYTKPNLVASFESTLRGYYIHFGEENGVNRRYFYHTRLYYGVSSADQVSPQNGSQKLARASRDITSEEVSVAIFRTLTFDLLETPSSEIELVAFESLNSVAPKFLATFSTWRDKYESFDLTKVVLSGHATAFGIEIGNQVLPEDTRLSFIINLTPFFTQEMPFISLQGFIRQSYLFMTPADFSTIRVRLVPTGARKAEITNVREYRIGWSRIDLTPRPF